MLRSESDTETLLHLYIHEKEKCLSRINGFFSLAIYDQELQEIFMARDRFGVKPLLIYEDEDSFLFASEMKALLRLGIQKELDIDSLKIYLQLNYIPQPYSVFKGVRKMMPGTWIKYSLIQNQITEEKKYYSLPEVSSNNARGDEVKSRLFELLDSSVQRRMISDVPLGCFLSGGIDSSIISALAARHTTRLKTFSIGFKDAPFYDETHFARLVAQMHHTDHTMFRISNNDLYEVLHDVLNYLDEPFADSSALNVFILSRMTRKEVTVALSGDGGDELFAGYSKHRAEWIMRHKPLWRTAMKLLHPILKKFSGSRHSTFANRMRQLKRFSEGAMLNESDRYWRWCGISGEKETDLLLAPELKQFNGAYLKRKEKLVRLPSGMNDLNKILYADMSLILPGDMLAKVDLMSMANGLEVRTPFLDYEVVDFAFSLPSSLKINKTEQKKLLKETFRALLPSEILNRAKKGFEVPLLQWFQSELKSMIGNEWLEDSFIREQKIFDPDEIQKLKRKLFTNPSGDIEARIWGLVVFQNWWKKYFLEK